MDIALNRNVGPNQSRIPYIIDLSLSAEVIPPHVHFRIPMYWEAVEHTTSIVKEVYSVEVCGFRIEAGNPLQVMRHTQHLLPALVNMARLPTYVFIARATRAVYPVYTIADEVMVTTPGGPVFRHVELAKVRDRLTDYLQQVNLMGARGHGDRLHVRGIDMSTLALRRPLFYFKKRVVGEDDFWAPVFVSGDGRQLYAFAASARQEVDRATPDAILRLQQRVGSALYADGRLHTLEDLRLDRLFTTEWEQLQTVLQPLNYRLHYTAAGQSFGREETIIPLYRHKQAYFAAEYRPDEDRYTLHPGVSLQDTLEKTSQDLRRRQLLDASGSMRLLSVNSSFTSTLPSALDHILARPSQLKHSHSNPV